MKGVLYPLMGILFVSSKVFSATSAYPELAVVLSGLLASVLIGAFYIGLPLSLVKIKTRRFRAWQKQKIVERVVGVSLLSGLVGILLGEFLTDAPLMMISASATVLAAMFLGACITSNIVSKRAMK
jgi:xanthosine utilization system XapX-like protein